MNPRRRNGLILLLVAGLVAASVATIALKKTRLGLDLKGGVELIYQAKPTKTSAITPDSLNRAIDIMRQRVDSLGVAEPEITTLGSQQIQVSLPGVTNLQRAVDQVGTTAQLYFYDWEASVVGPNGKTAPNDPKITGKLSGAGQPQSGLPYYGAVVRASRRPALHPRTATTNGLFYLVDDRAQTVVRGPEETRGGLFSDRAGPRAPGPGQRILEVRPGTLVVEAEYDTGKAPKNLNDARWYVLDDDPSLSGRDIKNPEQNIDQQAGGQPIVTFDFTDKGRKKWQTVTRRIAQRGAANALPNIPPSQQSDHFAIVLDDELVSVPYIDFNQNPDGIDGSTGSQISGSFTIASAQNLANLLKTGALPLKLDLISQSQVSATLGKQALHQGLIAGLVGFGVVALFLLAFYRVLGVIAVGALVIYAAYFFALIKLIPITLTLPGIAGLILTIAVAADANIVIFERVKEEIRGGRSIAAGIAAGYKKGLAAIIDANVVTFMVAFILFILATAGVKGFAFVLGIGTLVSLFTAVLATQAVLGTMGRSRALARRSALGAGEAKRRYTFDFVGASRWFFSASGLILLICALAIGGKGLNFGIDFESGTRITTALQRPADEGQVRSAIDALGFGTADVQKVSNQQLGSNAFQISGDIAPQRVGAVKAALAQRFGATPNFTSQSVGPTFGQTVARTAIIAIVVSLLVISVYIALRFEWKYAVPVLIAVMHDLLITAGVYALLGREVTTSTVAALLTILGFSLYDTIIVFDRVRENVPRMPRAAFSQIVNRSMSEVLTRSLATSFCTLLPVLALLLFGGDTLKDFAFALLVGTASGTYSSIFIASPVLTHWKERDPVYETRAIRIRDALGHVPAYAGAAADVPVPERPREPRRPVGPDGAPPAPSQAEFARMTADVQASLADAEPGGGVATEPRPGARRASAADLRPEDVVMPGTEKPKRVKDRSKPRNKRHGRAR